MTLHERVLLCVNGLTQVKTFSRLAFGARARMAVDLDRRLFPVFGASTVDGFKRERLGHLVAVRESFGDAVVTSAEHVVRRVDEDTTNGPATAGGSARGQLCHPQKVLIN